MSTTLYDMHLRICVYNMAHIRVYKCIHTMILCYQMAACYIMPCHNQLPGDWPDCQSSLHAAEAEPHEGLVCCPLFRPRMPTGRVRCDALRFRDKNLRGRPEPNSQPTVHEPAPRLQAGVLTSRAQRRSVHKTLFRNRVVPFLSTV